MKHNRNLAAGCITWLALLNLAWVPAQGAVTIISGVISGPKEICVGGIPGKFTLKMTGTGATGTAANFQFKVFDEDIIFDDLLLGPPDTKFKVDGRFDGIPPWDDTDPFGPPVYWEKSIEFELSCDKDGNVSGKAGSSGEKSAEVYVILEELSGLNILETNVLTVNCIKGPPCIPEPVGVFGVLGLLMAGAMLRVRFHSHRFSTAL